MLCLADHKLLYQTVRGRPGQPGTGPSNKGQQIPKRFRTPGSVTRRVDATKPYLEASDG